MIAKHDAMTSSNENQMSQGSFAISRTAATITVIGEANKPCSDVWCGYTPEANAYNTLLQISM